MRKLAFALFAVWAACMLMWSAAHAATTACGEAASYKVDLPGAPMGVVPSRDGKAVYVALNATNPSQMNGVAVLHCNSGRYSVARVYRLESQPTVLALTHDEKTLVVPDDNYIAFLDTKMLEDSSADPLAGYVEDIPGDDSGAVYAAVSPDDRYALIAEEQSGMLTVIDLSRIRAKPAGRDAIAAEFLIGNAPVALVYSKDGIHVFATVQIALNRTKWEQHCNPESGSASDPKEREGAVVVLDAARLVSDKEKSIVAYVPAGCHPVRAALTPDGNALWVSARKSNLAIAFDTAALVRAAPDARIGQVTVGPAPVPIVVSASGKHVLVGNSNRFNGANTDSSIDIIDAKQRVVVGHLKTGAFPRQFARSADGSTIFLSNYGSSSLSVIDATSL